MNNDGKYKVVSCVWKDLREEKAEDAQWIGDEVGGEDVDPHGPRKRIRGHGVADIWPRLCSHPL